MGLNGLVSIFSVQVCVGYSCLGFDITPPNQLETMAIVTLKRKEKQRTAQFVKQ